MNGRPRRASGNLAKMYPRHDRVHRRQRNQRATAFRAVIAFDFPSASERWDRRIWLVNEG
jgi:hypothetical protein